MGSGSVQACIQVNAWGARSNAATATASPDTTSNECHDFPVEAIDKILSDAHCSETRAPRMHQEPILGQELPHRASVPLLQVFPVPRPCIEIL
mmetsp:Transcript_61014/g.108595  ORF Transcript_61014/g.108595 Transcript_61014/m.108595 type:complete len:93 (+) Transcript_61014:7-285(+)